MPRKKQTYCFNCQFCQKETTKTNANGKSPRFCSTRCSNLWQYKCNGRIASSSYEARIKRLGEEVVKQQIEKQFISISCEWCKKECNKRRRNPLPRFCSQKCAQTWTANTHPRKWSELQRKEASERMAKRMQEHPESQYSHGISGWYKGKFFRSSYEYIFLKKMESENIQLDEIQVEPFSVYYEFEGTQHSYRPDFYIPSLQTVYEIKNSYSINDPKVIAKTNAAMIFFPSQGMEYKILTEAELNVKKLLSRKEIEDDPCVFLVPKNIEDDRWSSMFEQQKQFMQLLQKTRNFPEFPLDLRKKEHQKFIKDISHDCMHELFEAVHLLKNAKMHRATNLPDFDREGFLEELADVAHFLIEIFILLGVSPKEAFNAYMKKGTINSNRILSDY